MAVWTICAQEGTGGAHVAARLAAEAGVLLLDRKALALTAHALDPAVPEDDDLEGRVGGRLSALALGTAITTGSADAFREAQLRRALPALGRAVMREAARAPCVIYAPAAFAALSTHPSAIHVRLHAPLERRIGVYQRKQLVDRHCAEKALKRDDHRKQVWVRTLYRVDIDDARHFSLFLDASRLSHERLVDVLLAAADVQPALVRA
jgi:hypothetical protein